jgi:hypothetical protein
MKQKRRWGGGINQSFNDIDGTAKLYGATGVTARRVELVTRVCLASPG